jgi:hypothetical protein
MPSTFCALLLLHLQFAASFPAFLAAAQGVDPTSWPPGHVQQAWAALNGITAGTADTGSASEQVDKMDITVKDEQGNRWQWLLRPWFDSPKASTPAAPLAPTALSCAPNVGGFMLINTGVSPAAGS